MGVTIRGLFRKLFREAGFTAPEIDKMASMESWARTHEIVERVFAHVVESLEKKKAEGKTLGAAHLRQELKALIKTGGGPVTRSRTASPAPGPSSESALEDRIYKRLEKKMEAKLAKFTSTPASSSSSSPATPVASTSKSSMQGAAKRKGTPPTHCPPSKKSK